MLSARLLRGKGKASIHNPETYIRRHESQRSRIVNRNDAHFRNLGEHRRNKDPAEHRDAAAILMPVQSLHGRDADVHESIGPNESVANVHWLRLVIEKTEKAGQDQGLADGEREKSKPWDNDREEGRAQRDDTAKNEAMLARLSGGRCWIRGGFPSS